jgi:hypothetical protein
MNRMNIEVDMMTSGNSLTIDIGVGDSGRFH